MAEMESGKRERLLTTALWLGIITIVYNLAEGLVSTAFGFADDTLALAGFGFDSFVEVISGIGIVHMIVRMKRTPIARHDRFERTALRVTAVSFFLLAAGILIAAVFSVVTMARPSSTIPGVIVSVISIGTMWLLMTAKLRVGRALDSAPIVADAHCTRTCIYLSLILLASSGLYALFRIPFVDAAGSLGIGYFALREGIEALEKSRSGELGCACDEEAVERTRSAVMNGERS